MREKLAHGCVKKSGAKAEPKKASASSPAPLRKDDPVNAYGVTPRSSKGAAYLWGWVLQDDILRRVPWSAIASLERVPAL